MKTPTPPPLESYPEALRLRYAMLQLIDTLIMQRNIEALDHLGDVTLEMFSAHIEIEELSLIEITGYLGDAVRQLKAGRTPTEVLHAPLRTMQDYLQPQQEAQPPRGAKQP